MDGVTEVVVVGYSDRAIGRLADSSERGALLRYASAVELFYLRLCPVPAAGQGHDPKHYGQHQGQYSS
jgi:hypothetical protein